jgi:hypothetical protein
LLSLASSTQCHFSLSIAIKSASIKLSTLPATEEERCKSNIESEFFFIEKKGGGGGKRGEFIHGGITNPFPENFIVFAFPFRLFSVSAASFCVCFVGLIEES